MRVALFIPCFIDQFYPQIGLATAEVLERFGCTVVFPEGQTCCGQPMANSGCNDDAAPLARKYVEVFDGYDYIVSPSGSCTSMVRKHYDGLCADDDRSKQVRQRTYEFCEFLIDVLKVESFPGLRLNRKVAYHSACHGLRELRLGRASERMDAPGSKPEALLAMVEGLQLMPMERPDECCGFGGTFAVAEEAVSVRMGCDKLGDCSRSGADLVVSTDMSCLMHVGGLASRQKSPLRFVHIAEVLAGRLS